MASEMEMSVEEHVTQIFFTLSHVLGAESPIRPDSLQRAGALGLLRQLLATDVVDAEGFDDDAAGEKRTEWEADERDSQQRHQGTRWM